MNPLVKYPGLCVALPPRYYGTTGYYLLAAAFGHSRMDFTRLFDKREKAAHRCEIADKEGATRLTAPIGKPHGIPNARWSDVALSDHGRWWHVHRITLESAYGRSPFFEYYIDRFMPFLTDGVTDRFPTLQLLLEGIDAQMRECLAIAPADTSVPAGITFEEAAGLIPPELPPYWQVRGDSLGFIPGLSALDLIFNLGPEAPLYLKEIIDRFPALPQPVGGSSDTYL